jgi:hypothetical protein
MRSIAAKVVYEQVMCDQGYNSPKRPLWKQDCAMNPVTSCVSLWRQRPLLLFAHGHDEQLLPQPLHKESISKDPVKTDANTNQ